MSGREDSRRKRDMNAEMNWKDDPRLLAYALGEWAELGPADLTEIEAALKDDGACRAALDEIRSFIPRIEGAIGVGRHSGDEAGMGGRLEQSARTTIADAARQGALGMSAPDRNGVQRSNRLVPMLAAAAGIVTAVGASVWLAKDRGNGPTVDHRVASAPELEIDKDDDAGIRGRDRNLASEDRPSEDSVGPEDAPDASLASAESALEESSRLERHDGAGKTGRGLSQKAVQGRPVQGNDFVRGGALLDGEAGNVTVLAIEGGEQEREQSDAAARSRVPMSVDVRMVDAEEKKSSGSRSGRYRGPGDSIPSAGGAPASPRVATGGAAPSSPGSKSDEFFLGRGERKRVAARKGDRYEQTFEARESLTELRVPLDSSDAMARRLPENPFVEVSKDAFSTFSIDVDTASYTAARGAISNGRWPAPTQIRIEEFVNYFAYDDSPPSADSDEPFSVSAEVGSAPWAPEHRLVRIGLKAKDIEFGEREAANIVLLVDVSGSMNSPKKLPLVKKALGLLTESLQPEDRVAIVVYASGKGLALDSTPMDAREAVLQALERLRAGGSTNGGAGIQLAYSIARDHFVEGGVNRVILCTDGDFNVGVTSEKGLEELIAEEAAGGIELTVLGFGTSGSSGGDARMEVLSNRGNGNYAALDSELEARKVLASEIGGTLHTVAKDVKIQVAWNPAVVSHFRLIGYENRMLAHRDFLDDRKDAGEIGAGHGVTALYEVVPVGVAFAKDSKNAYEGVARGEDVPEEAAKRAQEPRPFAHAALGDRVDGTPLLDVRLRYKSPGSETSVGFEGTVYDEGASFADAPEDLRFAASVAAFAMILRGSDKVGDTSLADVRRWALEAKGADPGGLRESFIGLVEAAMRLSEGERPLVR